MHRILHRHGGISNVGGCRKRMDGQYTAGGEKSTAVEFIQQQLGISSEETCTFGDNLNDIAMLQKAGRSYAVANARAEVQAAARKVCPSYSEDGVLQILKGIVSESGKQ